MSGNRPANQNDGSVYSLTDTENNVSNVATNITGKLSPAQLSSYSDYSYLVTPVNNNPDALIFAKTLPGLTQGKRLTSTSATTNVDAHANDKPVRQLSLNENTSTKPKVDEVVASQNNNLGNARGRVVTTGGSSSDYVPVEQLRKFYHPPPSDYQNENVAGNSAAPSVKAVKTRASTETNNNRRSSKTSINSKATDASQFYYHRNLRNLPSVKEENVPKYAANVAADSDESSSGSSDATTTNKGKAATQSAKPGTHPQPAHPHVKFSPNTKTSPANLANAQHPKASSKKSESSSEDESSESSSEESKSTKRTSGSSGGTATTGTTATTTNTTKTATTSTTATTDNTTATTTTTDKSSSQRTSGDSASTGKSKDTSSGHHKKKTGGKCNPSQTSASGAGGHGGGGGGKKNNDDHHHHHPHHKKSSSSEESSEEESSSEEEAPAPHPHKGGVLSNHQVQSNHQIHSSHNVQSNHSVHSNKCGSKHNVHSAPSSGPGSAHSHPLPRARPLPPQQYGKSGQEGYMSTGGEYHDGDAPYIPPVGSIRVGSPWPGIPIVDKKNEFSNKGINVDVAQEANPPGGNQRPPAMAPTARQGRESVGTTSSCAPHNSGSGGYALKKNHSSTLDVSINKKPQGSSTIHLGEGGAGGRRATGGSGGTGGRRAAEGSGGGGSAAYGSGGRRVMEGSGGGYGAHYPEYEYYQGNYPQDGPTSFDPYGAGMPIRNKFSDSPSNVNVFVRQNGGNEGYDDMGYVDPGPPPPPEPSYDYNDNNGNYAPPPMMPMMPFPMPIPYPMPCPCPCPPQCPPPPPPPPPNPCCCSRRKPKKKKKKKKSCDKQWDMMSMYGMYTLFQQMFSSWQNQMTEQYERSRPKPPPPPPQYAVVMGNPCQMMSMMGGGGACCPPVVMMPGLGGMMGGLGGGSGGSSRNSNPIFEVTGVEVRGDSNDC